MKKEDLIKNTENALAVIEELIKTPCQCNKVSLVTASDKDLLSFCSKCQLLLHTRNLAADNIKYFIDNMIMEAQK
jgi:hypothetical protein